MSTLIQCLPMLPSKMTDNSMGNTLLLSPPLTPTDCTDTSCPWKQGKVSLMSYQHGSAEHDSYRAEADSTNRMAHDQQHDHPSSMAPAALIKNLHSDRTKRNKSFIYSYRRYHPTHSSHSMPQTLLTPQKRCIRKTTKAYRSPDVANTLNIFGLDIYDTLLREPNQLVRSVKSPTHPSPPPSTTGSAFSADDNTASSSAPFTRKEKTQLANAASYDAIDIENEDSAMFSDKWIPKQDVLDHKRVKIVWKGAPLKISHLPMYGKLHSREANIASTLRLTPVQYIRCKRTLIRAAIEYERHGTPFRKSDAQKLCRVDVNKTSSLWSIFGELGWLGQTWPN